MEGIGFTPAPTPDEPMVIFFDLKTEKIDNNVVQTVEYQERCDPFKSSKNNVNIIELVAYNSIEGQVFHETFKNQEDVYFENKRIISTVKYRSVLSGFLQWMNGLKEYEGQKIILVAHNNLFFHFHILKWTFKTFLPKVSLPDYDIYFFDSMTLVKKFQLIGWLI